MPWMGGYGPVDVSRQAAARRAELARVEARRAAKWEAEKQASLRAKGWTA